MLATTCKTTRRQNQRQQHHSQACLECDLNYVETRLIGKCILSREHKQKLLSCLGSVVVSVLATGPKGRGFKLRRGDGFLRAIIKIRSTPSFGWKVSRSPHVRFYGMLKIRWRISDVDRQNSHSVQSSYFLPDVAAGRTVREVWWTSQEYSPAGIIITLAIPAWRLENVWWGGSMAVRLNLGNIGYGDGQSAFPPRQLYPGQSL
jgi:hypothetical protein